MANKDITAMSDWKKMLNTGKSYGKIRAEQIKRDFGGNPSDQSWNPTREEVKKWNKESRDHNKAMAEKKKRLVKGSKWNPIKAISSKKTIWKKHGVFKKTAAVKTLAHDIGAPGSYTAYDKNLKNLVKRINLAGKNWGCLNATRVKQVLPTVGRTLGVASGWGTLIAGASLLAQTKKAKQFRQDPTHRRATIKKLFKVRN